MLLEVSLHYWIILGIFKAESMPLKGVFNISIVVDLIVTSMTLWLLRPSNELIEVFALHDLIVTNAVLWLPGRHWSIVGFAHDVLSHGVQAVKNMMGCYKLLVAFFKVNVRFADQFL